MSGGLYYSPGRPGGVCSSGCDMDAGACLLAPSAPTALISDDQIVPAHPSDSWSAHQNNHTQPFLDAWLQMQVGY